MNASEQVIIRSLDTGGWQVQIMDSSKTPPKVLNSKYTDLGGVASIFAKAFAFNTSVLDVQLLALATSASNSTYLFLDPAKYRAVRLYRDSEHINSVNIWTPPAVWLVTSPSAKTNKWSGCVMLVRPEDDTNTSIANWKTGQYPMSNTYDNGDICWGSVRFPTFTFPRDLKKVADLFWASDFNGHVWHEKKEFFKYVESLKESKVSKLSEEKRWDIVKTATGGEFKFTTTVEAFWNSMTKSQRGY